MRWKQWCPNNKFIKYATQAPHINLKIVGKAKDNFRCSVVSALNVGKSSGAVFTTRSKIDNFNFIIGIICEQNVFRLQITVNYSLVLHVFQALAYLFGYNS